MTSLKRSETQKIELKKVFSEHKRETLAPAVEACIRKHAKNLYPDNVPEQADFINKELLSLVSKFIDEDIRKFFVRGHALGNSTTTLADELIETDPALSHILKIEELDSKEFRRLFIHRNARLKLSDQHFPKKFIPVWDAALAEKKESEKDIPLSRPQEPLSKPQEQHASLSQECSMSTQRIDLGRLRKRRAIQNATWWDCYLIPPSFLWINSLCKELESVDGSEQRLQEVLQSSKEMLLSSDPDRVRFELARIPVEVKIHSNAEGILVLEIYIDGLSFYPYHDVTTLIKSLPADYTVDKLKVNNAYWFHFTEDEVRRMNLDTLILENGTLFRRLDVPIWEEDNSLVDKVLRGDVSAISSF